MKIHGICLVKNEGDIVEYTLAQAARWCDSIYVYDNGSEDDTWEIVNSMAAATPCIIPFRRENLPFDNALRSKVYNHFKKRARAGDWWCRLDADEVYIDDPRIFLGDIPKCYHVLWAAQFQYYLTDADVQRFAADEAHAPKMNAGTLPRSYAANASEARFFRHRDRLRWDYGAWPRHLGLVFPTRIRLKHFQNRSPAQIQLRLDTRHRAIRDGTPDFPHIDVTNWRDTIPKHELSVDTGDGRYEIDECRLPPYRETPLQQALKRFMHGLQIWP